MEAANMTSLVALGIGFLHALEPGHGKTALFTYLASGKKSWWDGIVISLSSALTHSAAVLIIAFGSHLAIHHGRDLGEESIHNLSHYLGLLSGGIIFSLGIWVIIKARKGEDLHANCCGHDHGHHHHEHDHDHKHHHHHEHKDKPKVTKSGLLASGLIGIATGIIPCPTVIVAYLSGVSTGNSLVAMQSVVYFALGMFFALLSVVLAFNLGGQKIADKFSSHKTSRWNWGYIQGGLFLIIGTYTAFLH